MPVIKSAIKKMRQAEQHREHNRGIRRSVKEVLDDYRAKPSLKTLPKTSSVLAKAAKRHVIHRNKAARLQSRLAKLLSVK